MATRIQVTGLEIRFGDRIALSRLDLEAEAPCSIAVIGRNGSGKSTLLAALTGLAAPFAGSVAVDAPAPPALVLQSTDVDRSLPITVRTVVGLARYPRVGLLRPFSSADRRAVDRAMSRVGVDDLAERQLHELSGGQRQRTLVAQGLAQESEILLLDEPVTGLDLTSRSAILDLVDEERALGRLVIMTTHDLDDARRCDLVLLLDTVPVAVGPPDEVLTPEHLQRAFGGHFLSFGDDAVLDDPHHEH